MSKFLLCLLFLSSIVYGEVKFSPLHNYSKEEKEVAAIAERLSNEMLQSKSFENFMIERATPRPGKRYLLHSTNGKTAKEVVDHLKALDLTVPVWMYWSLKRVVGYRQPPKPDIHTNRRYHAGSTACARASNLLHEWTHSGGYGHSYRATYERPYSVPYSINAAFSELCSCNGIRDCKIKGVETEVKPEENPAQTERKFITVCRRIWYTLWIKKSCYKKGI